MVTSPLFRPYIAIRLRILRAALHRARTTYFMAGFFKQLLNKVTNRADVDWDELGSRPHRRRSGRAQP